MIAVIEDLASVVHKNKIFQSMHQLIQLENFTNMDPSSDTQINGKVKIHRFAEQKIIFQGYQKNITHFCAKRKLYLLNDLR